MKLLTLALLLTSCTATRIVTQQWSVTRLTLLSTQSIPNLTISARGAAHLQGYQSAPDDKSVSAAVAGATRALMMLP